MNNLISIFNCTSHLNPCTFGIPEGNARTIASYSLVYHFLANREDIYFQCPTRGKSEVMGGGGSLSLLSAVYKCAVYKFKPPAIDILNWKTFHIFNVHMYSNILINQNFNPTSLTTTQEYILLWWRFRLDTWIDTRKRLVTLLDNGRGPEEE